MVTKTPQLCSYAKKILSTGFAHIFLSNSFNKVISFASGLILVRLLSKEDYGIYAYAFTVFSFFVLVSGLGLNSGLLQLGSELGASEEENRIYHYSVKRGLFINLLLSVLIVIVSFTVKLPIKGSNSLLLLLSFMLIPILLTDFQTTRMRALLLTKRYSLASVLSGLFILTGSVLGAWIFVSRGLIIGRYIAYLSLFVIFAKLLKIPFVVTKEKPTRESINSLWKVSVISMINNGLSSLLTLLELLLLGLLIKNTAIVASYKVATTIPFALDFIPQAFVIFIYPYFARHRGDNKWIRKNYCISLSAVALCTSIISAGLIIFAPFIIKLCFGMEYLDSINCFRVLLIAFAVGGTFRVISGNILVTQRRLKFNLIVALIGTVVNVATNLALIPVYGAFGAALAHLTIVVITGLINTCGVFWYTSSKARLSEI